MAALPAEILDEAVDDLHVARVDLGPRGGVGQRGRLGEVIGEFVGILVVVIPRVVVGGGRGRGALVQFDPVGLCHGGDRRETHAPGRDFEVLL